MAHNTGPDALDKARRAGADAKAYGWARNYWGDYSEDEKRAYDEGYYGKTEREST